MANNRVLHVVDRLTGGVPLAVRDYVLESDPKFEHAIASPFIERTPATVWSSIDVQHFDIGEGHLSRTKSVGRAFRAFRPDVVHAHSSFSGAYARIGVPDPASTVVYSPHCFKFDDPSMNRVARTVFRNVERLLARRTLRFAVLSPHERALAASLHATVDLVIVPNRPSVPNRTQPSIPEQFRIGMSGRIATQKDPAHFIRVVEATRRHAPELHATASWIGDGDPAIRTRLERAGVHVLGWQSETNLTDALDSLSVYVHTARYEGFPLSVLDAAARGIPIIVRAIPAFESTPLTKYSTPEEAAALVTRLSIDDSFRVETRLRGDALLKEMNARVQRDALRIAWTPVP